MRGEGSAAQRSAAQRVGIEEFVLPSPFCSVALLGELEVEPVCFTSALGSATTGKATFIPLNQEEDPAAGAGSERPRDNSCIWPWLWGWCHFWGRGSDWNLSHFGVEFWNGSYVFLHSRC